MSKIFFLQFYTKNRIIRSLISTCELKNFIYTTDIMINTILFDKDGTLIDTEKYYVPTYIRAFEELGHPITRQQALLFRSLGAPYAEELVNTFCGCKMDWTAFRNLRANIFNEIIEANGLITKSEARKSLQRLKAAGYRLAIVTATPVDIASKELEKTNLLDMFEDIVSAYMVKRGKPAPDVYLKACEILKLDPADTIAVEDSPNGVLSASDAGCNTVMIPDLTEPDEELSKRLYSKQPSLVSLADWLCSK